MEDKEFILESARRLERWENTPRAVPDGYADMNRDELIKLAIYQRERMEEVEAFCVFGFCEAPTQWGNYVEGKGIAEWFKVSACAYSCLLDENFRPKASYYILKRMARELGILREKGSDSRETH